jgi:hypothetical protein
MGKYRFQGVKVSRFQGIKDNLSLNTTIPVCNDLLFIIMQQKIVIETRPSTP